MRLRLPIDPFLVKLFVAVALASLFPAHGVGATLFAWAANIGISLLFFLHGAKLSREALVAGAGHWRLHINIFFVTFVVFPVLGVLAGPLLSGHITPELHKGVLFLCCLPATMQSAIAFTAIARGNMPAAVCSASASNLLGVFVTPLLAGLILAGASTADAPISLETIGKIMLQLLLPFLAGQLFRPWVGHWMSQHTRLLRQVDQGSIMLVVYTAFSAAMIGGLWTTTPLSAVAALLVISIVLLAVVLGLILLLGRLMRFNMEDRITLLFCGAKKSLSTGIPIANILFAGDAVGAVVLPIMIFHQVQLIVCATIAGIYARRPEQS